MKPDLKKVDGFGYPCCKRYYFYSQHSSKCQKENNLTENQSIGYAEVRKEIKE